MNEDKVISKIKQLKKIEPSREALSQLRQDIYSRIDSQKVSHTFNLPRVFSGFLNFLKPRPRFLYTAVIIIFLLVTTTALNINFLTQQSRLAIVQTQIALVANKYEKSQLALTFSQNQLVNIKQTNQKDLATQVKYLSDATAETNTRLASLNLMGEKGKYTNEQCLAIYKNYQVYLEQLKPTIKEKIAQTSDTTLQKKLQSFSDQIDQYEKQAEVRLKLY